MLPLTPWMHKSGGLAGNQTQTCSFAGSRDIHFTTKPKLVDREGLEPSTPPLKGAHVATNTCGPKMVPGDGIEPPTPTSSALRSTTELTRH